MAELEKDDSIYTFESEDKMGYIQIADDVVSSIAAIAILSASASTVWSTTTRR